MSLFKAVVKGLFGIKNTITDSFFGEMEAGYVKVNNKRINYFSCQKNFFPDKTPADITVYTGNSTGPSERQRETCKNLVHNYFEITDKINSKIRNEYADAAEKLKVTDINTGFTLESISIHEEENPDIHWDLEYIGSDNKVYVDVNFIGSEIDFIDIDSL